MRNGATAGALALLLSILAASVAVGEPAGAADLSGRSVSAAPTAGLRDGQTVTITLRSTAAFPIYSAEAHVCRRGVTYQVSTGARPHPDFALDGPNCPLQPISSSAESSAVDSNTYQSAQSPAGETFSIRAGTGQVNWNGPDGPVSLRCDSDNPCLLVVELLTGAAGEAPAWVPWTQELTYLNADAVAGCGGSAAGALSSGGGDRITDAWINWTLSTCRAAGSGAPTTATFNSEGEAVAAFAEGTNDFAYTAVGYDDAAGLVPRDPAKPNEGRRPAAAVPIALNATVLAVGNGKRGNNGRKVPYTDVRLTLDEVATLLSGGPYAIDPHVPAILARNPELAQTGFFNTNSVLQVGAPANADATSFFMTRYLSALRPGRWVVPDLPGIFGADAGKPRSAHAALATAHPEFNAAITMLPGRPALERGLFGLGGSDYGGVWVLTDLETSRALGLTPVKIENAAGQFVEPTPETMKAAVAGAATAGTRAPAAAGPAAATGPGSDRLFSPDPASTNGYPLTFVEYALAPTEPLVAADGCPRVASQKLLKDWLGYVTGPGQSGLPAGMEPLTPELAAQAEQAIERVGSLPASPTPAGCQEAGPDGADGGLTGADSVGGGSDDPEGFGGDTEAGDGSDGGSGLDGEAGGDQAGDGATDPGAGDGGAAAGGDTPSLDAAATASGERRDELTLAGGFPELLGGLGPGGLTAVIALLALAGLVTFAVQRTSRAGGPPAGGRGP